MRQCQLCPHNCQLAEGQTGFCRTRRNDGSQIIALNYGQVTSLALDPVEKKPLYHFFPGSFILSVGSFGCNMQCPFCQNHSISQNGAGEVQGYLPPAKLVELAVKYQKQGSIGVAFTYNEPLLSYEYIMDTAPLLRAAGQKVVLVSNGQINFEPWKKLLPWIDAVNIDLKAFTPELYTWMGGDLQTTKQTIAMAVAAGVHTEVTTLVIPEKNDDREIFTAEVRWLAGLSPDIPLHLSRYFPRYKWTTASTPRQTLEELRTIAARCLRHVHLGNV